MKKVVWLLVIVGLIVLVDQLSKMWVMQHVAYIWNTGAAWGWGGKWLASGGVQLLLCLVLIWWIFKRNDDRWWSFVGVCLIVGGGLSNIVDRIVYGAVVDWIVVFQWFPWFNVADAMISVGVGLILLVEFR